jgi:hypothetical protein
MDLARIAGSRWAVEECFQQASNTAGLDEYQVRDWRAWYGWWCRWRRGRQHQARLSHHEFTA